MKDSFKQNFEKLIASLNNSNINFVHSDMRYRDDHKPVHTEVQKDIALFYAAIEYANCKWVLKEPADGIKYLDKEIDIVGGEFNIPSLDRVEVLMNENDYLKTMDPFSVFDEATKQSLKEYAPFDIVGNEFVICYKKNDTNDNLYLIDYSDKGEIVSLKTGVTNYLQNGFDHTFFFGWQKAIFFNNNVLLNKIDFYLNQLLKTK